MSMQKNPITNNLTGRPSQPAALKQSDPQSVGLARSSQQVLAHRVPFADTCRHWAPPAIRASRVDQVNRREKDGGVALHPSSLYPMVARATRLRGQGRW